LVEGVDLPDDLARFMILLKTPYPNLGNNLNKQKLNLMPDWFEYATSLQIIQMLGRPIRHKTDSCVTYLIDSNFHKFFSMLKAGELFPEHIVKRIK
jgi:Rad3-related DNA helicase